MKKGLVSLLWSASVIGAGILGWHAHNLYFCYTLSRIKPPEVSEPYYVMAESDSEKKLPDKFWIKILNYDADKVLFQIDNDRYKAHVDMRKLEGDAEKLSDL